MLVCLRSQNVSSKVVFMESQEHVQPTDVVSKEKHPTFSIHTVITSLKAFLYLARKVNDRFFQFQTTFFYSYLSKSSNSMNEYAFLSGPYLSVNTFSL